MSKRADDDESSHAAAAHKRGHAAAPQDESPPPSSAASPSLTQASSSSIPKIPLALIADLILPFIVDRATWNSVYCASRELCLAGKKMTPPWPNTTLDFGCRVAEVCRVAFSPSGSHLAAGVWGVNTDQHVVHVWDRWGKETLFVGQTGDISCLEYSSDGKYLASGSDRDGSIRLWHCSESFHAASSNIFRAETLPAQAVEALLDRRFAILTLSFSRTDSNLLASGGANGDFKVWNVKDQTCIHSFDPGAGIIRSLFFAGSAESACIAVGNTGSIIRLLKAEDSSDYKSETIGEGAAGRSVFSPSGSFLAASRYSCIDGATSSTLRLYELETMTKTQSVVMPGVGAKVTYFAISPDNKQLIFGDYKGRSRLIQSDDFNIQRNLNEKRRSSCTAMSVAFDPTGRVLAFGRGDGTLELLTL